MDIFDVLTLIGGLCLFLFGMNLMGDALERSAGSKLEIMIGKLTTDKLTGLLTGLGVTAVIQSSSATTVMKLKKAKNLALFVVILECFCLAKERR